jgi:hypothetical protein
MIAALTGVAVLRGPPSPAPPSGTASTWCGRAGKACEPAEVVAFGSARYRFAGLSRPAVVVIGRWACSPVGIPAVVYLGSGQVWLFPGWPGPGSPAIGTLAGIVPGAKDATTVAVSAGCDALRVQKRGGGTVRIVPVYRPKPAPGS